MLKHVFDEPGLTRLSLADLQQTQVTLSTAYTYQNYYRERTPGIGSQSLAGEGNALKLFAVNTAKHMNYGVSMRLEEGQEEFSNMNADLSVNTEYLHKTRDLALQIAIAGKRILWGVGLDQGNRTMSAPMVINKYPESEDSQMTRYFLDWLEPSFGNQLNFQGEFEVTGLQTFSTFVLGRDLMMNLNYRVSDQSMAPALEYVNNSNIPELQGDRQMIFDLALVNQCLEIGFERPQWSLSPGFSLHNSSVDMTIDNPLPEDVIDDFKELGWFEFSRKGAALSLDYEGRGFDLESGIGYSQWGTRTELKTPVLGRYWFFPISHAAQLDISGRSISQRLILHRELTNGGLSIAMNAGYQHAYFNLRVSGEAELEFNIRSVPIDYPYQFHLHVIFLGVPLSYTFKSFILGYEFNQLIPWFERVDDSDLRFQGEGTRPGKIVRGGGQHRLGLTYVWK
ncbi:MAG: hypothetical protein K9M85_08085 [Candidatus Marinimicrobia bacterium]|nr:hypothetical protein [Candidatus Neomarinimicrobiota bacterium]